MFAKLQLKFISTAKIQLKNKTNLEKLEKNKGQDHIMASKSGILAVAIELLSPMTRPMSLSTVKQ
jgi:hypothetical protein